MHRRNFIKSTCLTCAGVMGIGAIASMLTSCAPLPAIKTTGANGVSEVLESAFTADQTVMILKNSSLEFDALLVKKKDGTYNALYMQCTHESQPLSATKSGLFCSSHGSAFDLEGNVTVQPAVKKLRKFKTEVANGVITVKWNEFV